MTTLVIPTVQGEAFYSIRTRLDGSDYNLRFAWNERADRWHLDIADEANIPLVTGIKIMTNWPLIRYYRYNLTVPQGSLLALTTTLDLSPPGLYDLGEDRRVSMVYIPVADLT